MDPLTIILATAFVITWLLLLMKYICLHLIAAWRGDPPPHLARKEARERLQLEFGVTTPGKALADRVTARIENPPQRRWAAELRQLLAELAADAATEARVRHELRRRARVYRRAEAAGFRVRTGGPPPRQPYAPPPPPDPEPEPAVVEPDPDPPTPPPPPAAEEPPPPPPGDGARTDNRGDDMPKTATAEIDGDVRDPRTAHRFATQARNMNDGIAAELTTLAGTLGGMGVGKAAVGEVNVLVDAARTFSRSNQRSADEYAEHMHIQADLAADDDLSGTVRRTYLDTKGSDAGTPNGKRGGKGKTHTVRAADVDNPAAAVRLMEIVAAVYQGLKEKTEAARNKHRQQGVSDEPVEFLTEQLALATQMAEQAKRSAARFRRHVSKGNDTVGKKKAVGGTQTGKYLDPAKR